MLAALAHVTQANLDGADGIVLAYSAIAVDGSRRVESGPSTLTIPLDTKIKAAQAARILLRDEDVSTPADKGTYKQGGIPIGKDPRATLVAAVVAWLADVEPDWVLDPMNVFVLGL